MSMEKGGTKMKHNYLLITAGDVVNTDSRFYKVPVGTSKRDLGAFRRLYKISVENGYYFKKWDAETTRFLSKVIESVYGTGDIMAISQHLTLKSCADLLTIFNDGTKTHEMPLATRNAAHCMRYLNLNFRCTLGRKG